MTAKKARPFIDTLRDLEAAIGQVLLYEANI